MTKCKLFTYVTLGLTGRRHKLTASSYKGKVHQGERDVIAVLRPYCPLNQSATLSLHRNPPIMAPTLPPMPLPGLIMVPNWTAQKHETFVMKTEGVPTKKAQSLVSYCTSDEKAGEPFLKILEEEKNIVKFMTMDGQEAMRINVHRHTLARPSAEYKAVRSADAKPLWDLELKAGWRVPSYSMSPLRSFPCVLPIAIIYSLPARLFLELTHTPLRHHRPRKIRREPEDRVRTQSCR